ncbi:MAG: hypothetical protein JSW40_06200 [Candidatus Omnitrophota bacterium]|nr:MAG: hypothetical protein JSW40_06200 [Candidatus Omnitrophota bacterium]
MKSPLLFPVQLRDKSIVVLDETLLPFKEEYITVTTLNEALLVLGEMKTRSLGQVLLFLYCCVLFERKVSIDEIVHRFKEKRPTFDFAVLGEILKIQIEQDLTVKQAVGNFVKGFDALRRARAKRLAEILPCPAHILTICNVNGELIYLYEELRKLNKPARFIVCETRPYLQGSRLTFWELRKNNICCTLICDSQAAGIMKAKGVNCVITGADRATIKGDVVNKIGTYSLARLARYFNIPFYPLTQYPRDIDVASIEIEERPKPEVFMYLDGDFSRIDALYPSFDITKAEFVTRCIELETYNEACRYQ